MELTDKRKEVKRNDWAEVLFSGMFSVMFIAGRASQELKAECKKRCWCEKLKVNVLLALMGYDACGWALSCRTICWIQTGQTRIAINDD